MYVKLFPCQLHEILTNSGIFIFPPVLHIIEMCIILTAAVRLIPLDRYMTTFSRLLPRCDGVFDTVRNLFLKLVRMLSKLLSAFTVTLQHTIELIFGQDAKLAITTANSTFFRSVFVQITIESG